MRRFLILFLLVLMPLQFSTAAVAAYCMDEVPTASSHFGHHDHDGSDKKPVGDDSQPDVDKDCGVCHLFCAKVQGTSAILGVFEPGMRPADFIIHPDPQHAPEPSDRPPIAQLA